MTLLQYIGAIAQLCYLTLSFWLVGTTEDYYYVAKAQAWADLGGYPQAIRCYKKALKQGEITFVRGPDGMVLCLLVHDRRGAPSLSNRV